MKKIIKKFNQLNESLPNIKRNDDELFYVKKTIDNLLDLPIDNIKKNIIEKLKKVKSTKEFDHISIDIVIGYLNISEMGDIIEEELQKYKWIDYKRNYDVFMIRIKIDDKIWETPLIYGKSDSNQGKIHRNTILEYRLWLNTGGYLDNVTEKVMRETQNKYNI